MDRYLADQVIPALSAVVGARLARVIYWCSDEYDFEYISDPSFEMTGEVELEFEGGIHIYLTWLQNAPSYGDNAIWVHSDPRRVADVYAPCEASTTPIWKPLLNAVLQRVEVLGWGIGAHAVKFYSSHGNVYIGVGLVVQSGDDVFVRSEADFLRWPRAEEGIVFWSCE